jgi:hypothetical protein
MAVHSVCRYLKLGSIILCFKIVLSHGSVPVLCMDFNSTPTSLVWITLPSTPLPYWMTVKKERQNYWQSMGKYGSLGDYSGLWKRGGGRGGLWIKQKSLNRRRQGTVAQSAWCACGGGSLKRSEKGIFYTFALVVDRRTRRKGRTKWRAYIFEQNGRRYFLLLLDIAAYVTSNYVPLECMDTLVIYVCFLDHDCLKAFLYLKKISPWRNTYNSLIHPLLLSVFLLHGTLLSIISFTKVTWPIAKPIFTKLRNVQQHSVQICYVVYRISPQL